MNTKSRLSYRVLLPASLLFLMLIFLAFSANKILTGGVTAFVSPGGKHDAKMYFLICGIFLLFIMLIFIEGRKIIALQIKGETIKIRGLFYSREHNIHQITKIEETSLYSRFSSKRRLTKVYANGRIYHISEFYIENYDEIRSFLTNHTE
ncbi:hypothetical protein [Arcticibacter tournemirensis]|uniref:PH domain-containing protein n=1 Tax=Arcticibacter tournemirensis TaxID=699437 RepID=A0A4Q0MFL4_9SPHI|nr:hypothetical protein [Arcticibacter tournemirensis]RXF72290.1 hypothetical protein EKH83_00760 [Arcticibacter tournemirensis]